MASKVYILRTQLGVHPEGSVVVYDGMGSWLVGNSSYDTRGSIKEGEFAMLLDYACNKKLTSVLEPMEDEGQE